jgi:colanic acid/amylovoran biosynthesis glycosyltransferase
MPVEARVAYVVKRYPVYSETFIVNEILAHEAAGLELEIFALHHTNDQHFQDAISRVRAKVNYLSLESVKSPELWLALEQASTVFTDFWTKLEAAQGANVREVYQAVQLALNVRTNGITHLHAHFASTACTVARLAAKFAGITYSFTAHAKDIFHEEVNPLMLERKLKDASAVITVSDFNLNFLQAKYGRAAERVRRVYNGLNLEQFRFASPVSRPATIVSVGRLVEKKGFADLIEACAKLKDRGVHFSCQIIGSGELETELRALITRLQLEDCVTLSGPRPQREIIRLVQSASVFAAPCVIGEDGNRDGLPTVLLEAMALGTPCVASDVTGIPEVIRDNTGLCVPPHDPAKLADACQRLLEDASLRLQLATNARALIEAEFDVHRNAASIRNVFAPAALEMQRRPEHALMEVV